MQIEQLKKYKYKYDLHVHTSPVSMCGHVDTSTTVKYYADLGYSGIVITNHLNATILRDFKDRDTFINFYLEDYYAAKEAGINSNLQVFLGLEMRFPENESDYLVYGVSENEAFEAYDYIYGNYEEFYRGFKKESNLIIQAHPFRSTSKLQELNLLDGIEVYNMHPNHNSRIAVAAKLASENPRLIVTGGTDFHYDNHQGMCAMCSKEKILDSSHLVTLLKSRDYIFDVWGNKIIL